MAQSKTLLKICNFALPFTDFLYILQIEEYDNSRFFKWLSRFFLRRNFQVREHLVLTQRAKLTLLVSAALWVVILMMGLSVFSQLLSKIVFTIVWALLVPFCVVVANTVMGPFIHQAHERIRQKVKRQVAELPNLKIVVIAGSYGKTTVKNFIYQLVQFNYKTLMVPGNINTAMGIALWVKHNLQPATELLIVEVDTYQIGEIKKSCEAIPADIAVLTSVGDQHMERLGTEANLIQALSEVFTTAKEDAHLVLPIDSYSKLSDLQVGHRSLHAVEPHPPMMYQNQHIDAPMLSISNQSNLRLALEVADILQIPLTFVIDTISKIALPERRQQLTEMYGFLAIDDSYNISFSTAIAGLEVAKQQAQKMQRKLLVITAGIPELSPNDQDKNAKFGSVLAQTADKVIVLESIFADEITAGISDDSKVERYENLQTFLEHKGQYSPSEWFLLVQPELNDLYY